jgi:hypothetical protein
MKRRAFAAWAAGVSLQARAQGAPSGSRPARIALVSGAKSDPRAAFLTALRLGLAEVGRVEDRDFRFEMHWGENAPDRFDAVVAELLRSKPDVIVTRGRSSTTSGAARRSCRSCSRSAAIPSPAGSSTACAAPEATSPASA